VAPVVVGTALAIDGAIGQLVWWRFVCALVVAVSVQVGTNYANDYADGVRGTDDPDARQGPPRLVGNGLADASSVKRAMLVAFGITVAAGMPLVLWVDWWLAVVGAAAVAAGWFYTGGPRPYGYAGFGELFVFVFFGLVATAGSAYVQTTTLTLAAVLCGAAMGCWATALLVVNNLRDIPGDTDAGKRTLAVRLGAQRTRRLYTVLVVTAFLLLPVLVAAGTTPLVALAFVAVVVARGAVVEVLSGGSGAALIPVLVRTGRAQLAFAGGLTTGLLLA
jgi:1,4-dihydroxy-2-naphthoate octaprenyltransferase